MVMAMTKPKIVIIGAGMAGIAAATKLDESHFFDISVVEGGDRVGGRINSSQFGGNRIELGATWIHGIEGNPIYKIAEESNLLHSLHPWECMDGIPKDFITVAEGGHVFNPSLVEPISKLFKSLLSKPSLELESQLSLGSLSVGSFLRQGFESYGKGLKRREGELLFENWTEEKLERAIFALHENSERSNYGVDDLEILDYRARQEYTEFPGDDITIGRGYSSVIEAMAGSLSVGTILLNKIVEKIEWCRNSKDGFVKLHFSDGSTMLANHVIVTVSLGVLKYGISEKKNLFDPPLPSFKTNVIARLGYGVVEKVYLKVSCYDDDQVTNPSTFPFLQIAFHEPESKFKCPEIPIWIRRLDLHPIYKSSDVLLSWFTGQDAQEVENLSNEEIMERFEVTFTNLLPPSSKLWRELGGNTIKFTQVKRSRWGTDPLFLGSYSYVPVGSSGEDFDALAEPLPHSQQLNLLFAGEATHRKHYSTTHGAYLRGIREADRLLQHYGLVGINCQTKM